MGTQSVERMSRIAAELRASMPPPTDHTQMQAADSQSDPHRTAMRSSATAPGLRRLTSNGAVARRGGRPSEPDMLLLEKVRARARRAASETAFAAITFTLSRAHQRTTHAPTWPLLV
jgi:hypothetical protein